mgnify:CR=1 FL=1
MPVWVCLFCKAPVQVWMEVSWGGVGVVRDAAVSHANLFGHRSS